MTEGLCHARGFAKLSLEKLTYPILNLYAYSKYPENRSCFFLRLSINSSKQVSNILYALISLIENDVCPRKSVSFFCETCAYDVIVRGDREQQKS